MSDTRDYSTAGAARPRAARRAGVIVAAVAVIVAAGIGGVMAANRASEPKANSAAAGASSGATPAPSASTRAAPAPTATPAKPTKAPTTAFPPVASHEIGGRYWAVYLALPRKADDPKAAAAERNAGAAGYKQENIVYGPIDCDDGAREGLGRAGIRLDPNVDYGTVKLFFSTKQHATQLVDAFQPGVIGTAFVTWSCAD